MVRDDRPARTFTTVLGVARAERPTVMSSKDGGGGAAVFSPEPPSPRARRALLALVAASALTELFLAWHFFGFLTGDDVEVLEAGFRAIGLHYTPWAIRNTLVSDALVAPVVAASHALGVSSVRGLVWLAAWPFAFATALNVYLVFRLAQRWLGSGPAALLAATFYASHWIPLAFGSRTYPRAISTTAVLVAVLLAVRRPRSGLAAGAAGALVAVAVAMRYSEAIFLAPLVLVAVLPRASWRDRARSAAWLAGGFALGFAALCGLYEGWTWGRPFAAFLAFARYTLVEGRASSLVPAQPLGWYLWHLPHWWCPAALPFAWVAARRREAAPAWLFIALPLAVLTAIHHKELRYLQGVVPFVAAVSAAGWREMRQAGWRRTAAVLAVLTVVWGLGGASYLEKTSRPAVLAAQALTAEPEVGTFAGVQLWAYGDRLYFGNGRVLRNLPFPTAAEDLHRLVPGADAVGLYTGDLERHAELGRELGRLGFCRWRDFALGGSKGVTVYRPCGEVPPAAGAAAAVADRPPIP